ncbi:hypothetical protein DICPUDRAFT_58958 [Dictyostelium purpureum]|uniref:Major facilitator superfamily (MFS) profile domain-containing protein n=1 Tax=Dictyostelium purpureum TaxID=5786 RepID=F1A3Q1_DICPU|nr:uncharacterized protein DICPUDRAFT_58958 [Dictyostelium purpureum]EGC29173.1 hypothetical protein DICPUDRAFT_58958 [Dictyostelium purpureum]|eukprot:XP_003294295.1 hypothetical protein DICPUDRAFT_58958 [Dictyostelium purpureum]
MNLDDQLSESNNRLSQRPAPQIISLIQSLLKNPNDDPNKRSLELIVKKYPSFNGSNNSLSQSNSSIENSPTYNANRSPTHKSQNSPLSRSSIIDNNRFKPFSDNKSNASDVNNNNNNINASHSDLSPIQEQGSINKEDGAGSSSGTNNNNLRTRLEIPTNRIPLASSNNAIDSSAAPSSNTIRSQQISQPLSEVPSSCSPPSNGTLYNQTINEKEEEYSLDNKEMQQKSVTVNISGDQQQEQSQDVTPSSSTSTTFEGSNNLKRMTKLLEDAPNKEYTKENVQSNDESSNTTSSNHDISSEDEKENKKELNDTDLQVPIGDINKFEYPNEGARDRAFSITDAINNATVGEYVEPRDRAFSVTEAMNKATVGEAFNEMENKQKEQNMEYIDIEGSEGSEENNYDENVTVPHQPGMDPKPLTPKQILIIFSGLMTSLFLSSLDLTIVATALPAIVADLHGAEQLPWVVTIYLLTSTSVSPLFGKFSDIFGKKILLLSSLVIFLIGSLLCAVATSMNMLILARAIQGVGGGGLMSAVMIVMAEIVPLRDRGKYQGLLGAVYAVSSVVGPLMGGTFTDNITWRWAFWINLPLGAVAFIVVFFALRIPQKVIPFSEGVKKIDVVGSLCLVAATICFLLGLSWGGIDYPWDSPIIICLLAGTGIFVLIFWINEKYWFNTHPIIPLDLFKTRNYVLCSIGSFLLGFVMFGVIYYIPLYFQYVKGATATASGLQLLPTMLGIVLFGAISGLLITKFGHYKSYPIVGMAFMMIGIYLLSLWDHNSTQKEYIGYQCFIGVGIGLTMQILVLIVQNSVNVVYISISTATVSFFRSIGGVVSVAVFSAILNQQFSQNLSVLVEKDAFILNGRAPHNFNIEWIKEYSEPAKSQIISSYQEALSTVFLSAAPFAGLGCVLVLFVRNNKLRTTMITQKEKDKMQQEMMEQQEELEGDEYSDTSIDMENNNVMENKEYNNNNNINNNEVEIELEQINQTTKRKNTLESSV